jgi:hypothetical protein
MFIAIDRPRHLLLSTTETRLDDTTLRHETKFTFQAVNPRRITHSTGDSPITTPSVVTAIVTRAQTCAGRKPGAA